MQKLESVSEEEIRLVVIGRTGCGKSLLGNQILMGKKFISALSPVSVTVETDLKWSKRKGIKVSVVDTPGFFHTSIADDNVKKQVLRSLQFTSPGPHAFLYTLRIGRYSDEELQSFFKFSEIFGDAVFDNTILVFTGKDVLEEDISIYVKKLPVEFKEMTKKCNGRIIAFNNLAADTEQDQQWDQLHAVIKSMTQEKGYTIFSPNTMEHTSRSYLDVVKMPYRFGKKLFEN